MCRAGTTGNTLRSMVEWARAETYERLRRLPGDQLVPDPALTSTHAVTVDAPPRDVWPWLIQMGSGRGGWYSYDWIDNLGRPSARTILPGFGAPAVGDIIPALPNATDRFVVWDVAADSHLIMGLPLAGGVHRATWGIVLEPRATGTRLYARARVARGLFGHTRLADVAVAAVRLVGPGAHYVMQRRQLAGIAERVSGRPGH